MKILFVGGTFDDKDGKPSGLVREFAYHINNFEESHIVDLYNGGNFGELQNLVKMAAFYDCVFWWPNVPNNYPKIRNVKEINPKTLLVSSKRNDNEKYNIQELINHSLGVKANLTIEFSKNKTISEHKMFTMRILDPLGNCWYCGDSLFDCCKYMLRRLDYLLGVTRQGTLPIGNDEKIEVPNKKEFFNIIKGYAETLHTLIMPEKGVTRFLGNTSFRCMRGFPSFRDKTCIYVSKRNVDKRYIGREAFVPVIYKDNKIYYYGKDKPSVDTPIQIRLYDFFPNINYMFHSHCYIKGAPFTKEVVPCGGLEEVSAICKTARAAFGSMNEDYYIINLLGHGSLVMVKNSERLKDIRFERRDLPENFYKNE